MEKNELLNCPFCGGTPTLEIKDHDFPPMIAEITCNKCGASIVRWTDSEAIEAWNRRADNAKSQ